MSYNLRPRAETEGNLENQQNVFSNIFQQLQQTNAINAQQNNTFTPNSFLQNTNAQQTNFSFSPHQSQQIVPLLQQIQLNQFELSLKFEIQKYFHNVDVYLESDIISRFGSYMTGIDLCVIYKEKLITIHLKCSDAKTSVKDISHFIFCSNHILKINSHFKLYMIEASKNQPTKNTLDLINDYSILSVISNNQQIFLSQLLKTILNIINDTSEPMIIC